MRAASLVATASTHLLWFGFDHVEVSTAADFGLDYVTFSAALVVAWMLALIVAGTRDSRILGTDSTEYRRIIAFRNILIHGYARIDDRAVWDIAQTKLPVLIHEVEALMAERP